jgi:uncharacterized protein
MITVKIARDQNLGVHAMTVSGHAQSGPYGYDLVCAAVSAITIGGINSIEALCHFQPEVEQASDGGYLHCSLPSSLTEEQVTKAQLLLEGMLVSMKTIEASYGKHIQVKDQEV